MEVAKTVAHGHGKDGVDPAPGDGGSSDLTLRVLGRVDPVGPGRFRDGQPAMTVNLWRYRRFILRNALNDIRHGCAGSAMGVAWNVLPTHVAWAEGV